MELRVEVSPTALGLLDETWLYRTAAPPEPAEGVLAWTTLEGGFAIVRTGARDAVHREKVLRALHARLGERPMLQLERPRAPPPKRKLARADWALARELAAAPWRAVDARGEKERARRLAEERVVTMEPWPRGDAFHLLLKMSPSSAAAARSALGALSDAFAEFLPVEGEAAHADAFALSADLEPARAVLGVASVQARRVEARWRDDAGLATLLRDAERRAA